MEEPLHDLTGAHCRFIRTRALDFDKVDCWKHLLEATELGFIVIAEAGLE